MNAGINKANQMQFNSAAEPVLAGQSARQQYRANASTLPEDAWYSLDDLMVTVAQERLNFVADLQAAGLVDTVSIGETVTSWQESNSFDEADIDMTPRSLGSEDASIFVTKYAPVPIIHKDFRINRRAGDVHDIRGTDAPKAFRSIMEKLEDLALNGWDQVVTDADGREAQIYGVTNHPDRNQVTGSTWGTPGNVDADVREAVGELKSNNYYGPYRLYVAGDVDDHLLAPSPDFDNLRLRQQIADMSAIQSVTPLDRLDAGEAVLMQFTSDVIDAKMIEGGPTDMAEWENTPFETVVKAFGGFSPRVKSDMGEDADEETGTGNRQSGIAHITGLS